MAGDAQRWRRSAVRSSDRSRRCEAPASDPAAGPSGDRAPHDPYTLCARDRGSRLSAAATPRPVWRRREQQRLYVWADASKRILASGQTPHEW